MHKRKLSSLITGIILSGSIPIASAAEGTFSAGTGFDFSTGNYGTSTTTDILSIPVFGKYETGPWAFKLTVPYVEISGPGNVVPGVGRVNAVKGRKGAAPGASTTESGIGDVVAAATYNVYSRGATDPVIDLTAKIKFGTADVNKGLGTGENDYFAQVDVYKAFDRVTALATVGYGVLGSSDSISLKNVLYGSIGGIYKIDEQTTGGLTLDLRQASSATSGARREATAFVTRKLDGFWKAQGYVLKGFADGSPDWGIGATIARSF